MSTPLEHWYGPSHQQFQYFFDYKQNIVVERKQNESFDAYTKTNQRTRNCATYQYSHTIFRKRSYWVPIMAEHLIYDQIIAEPKIESIRMYFQQQPQTFEEFVELKYPCYQTFLSHSKLYKQGRALADAISNEAAISVTDASPSPYTNTAAVSWIIVTSNTKPVASGSSGCPPFYFQHDSYGSEMFGIYNILVVTKLVCEYYKEDDGSITIACDNDASLLHGTQSSEIRKIEPKYFDLIWAASDIIRLLPITVRTKQVKGHAELNKRRLNKYERLNILMDY